MRLEFKATILSLAISVGTLAATFAIAPVFKGSIAVRAKSDARAALAEQRTQAPARDLKQEYALYERNCAHCHGEDARGNEGPGLYDLAMSDARISTRIKDGIKGEMPGFGSKLRDQDVAELIAYLRTLKD